MAIKLIFALALIVALTRNANAVNSACSTGLQRLMVDFSMLNIAADPVKTICSVSGRSVVNQVMAYAKLCGSEIVGLFSNSTDLVMHSIDMVTVAADVGLDLACEVATGPCSDVTGCFIKNSDTYSDIGMRVILLYVKNKYDLLPELFVDVYGILVEIADCLVDSFDECPETVTKLKVVGSSLMGVDEFPYSVMYQTIKNVRKGFEKNKECATKAMKTKQFKECFQSPLTQTSSTCELFEVNRACLEQTVGVRCGDAISRFIAARLPVFYPMIPRECVSETGLESHINYRDEL